MPPATATLILGIVAGWAATVLAAAVASRSGFTAPFNAIVPQSREPAALGGGIAIFLGLALALALTVSLGMNSADTLRVAAAAIPTLLLGTFDDFRPLRPGRKFLLQWCAALIGFAILFGGVPADPMPLARFVAGMSIAVVLMNAINFLDVSDGYAAAVSAVSFVGLAWLAAPNPVALATAGACVGFLLLNRPPAKIYMGDAGGHLLGMMAAISIIASAQGSSLAATATVGLACFAVSLLEVALLIFTRWKRGNPIWQGSPDHSALRLQRAGYGKAGAAMVAAAAQLSIIGLVAALIRLA